MLMCDKLSDAQMEGVGGEVGNEHAMSIQRQEVELIESVISNTAEPLGVVVVVGR